MTSRTASLEREKMMKIRSISILKFHLSMCKKEIRGPLSRKLTGNSDNSGKKNSLD